MCNKSKYFIIVTLTFFLTTLSALGEEQICKMKDVNTPPACNAGAKTAAELLASVVHLSDNDIRFRTKNGTCVFVDPVNGSANNPAAACGMLKPDLILITHSHSDHFQLPVIQQYLKLNPEAVVACPADVAKQAKENGISQIEIVKPNQKFTIAGIEFNTVPSYFQDPQKGHPKTNEWVGYVLHIDGTRYYVTGDTEPFPEMAEINPDVIFPLLWGCGGNIDQAVKMAQLCNAGIVVPVHHGGQIDAINKYVAGLPKGVQCAYYKNARLICVP